MAGATRLCMNAMTKKPSDLFAHLTLRNEGGFYVICRGDQPLATPAQHPYALPNQALAQAVADEWRAQGEKIVPASMPMTQLASTALDIVAKDRDQLMRQILSYATTELLCHRADHPPELAARQNKLWQPYIDWCALRYKALLNVGTGIMPIAQTAEALGALHDGVAAYDDFMLAGLSHAVDVSGSLVLGLALAERVHSATDIFMAAELDASFQTLQWGADPVATARFDSVRRDLGNCERWFRLLS